LRYQTTINRQLFQAMNQLGIIASNCIGSAGCDSDKASSSPAGGTPMSVGLSSDGNLVKTYATDFCGVKTLRDATREQVEAFVAHLADWAEKDRNALLCQLNSYPR
jgi:hypothetical protein